MERGREWLDIEEGVVRQGSSDEMERGGSGETERGGEW